MKIYVPEDHAKLKIAMATIASLPDEYLTIAAPIFRKLFPDLISNFRQRPFTHAKSRLIGNLDLPQ